VIIFSSPSFKSLKNVSIVVYNNTFWIHKNHHNIALESFHSYDNDMFPFVILFIPFDYLELLLESILLERLMVEICYVSTLLLGLSLYIYIFL
jgi:hypothetical protein